MVTTVGEVERRVVRRGVCGSPLAAGGGGRRMERSRLAVSREKKEGEVEDEQCFL